MSFARTELGACFSVFQCLNSVDGRRLCCVCFRFLFLRARIVNFSGSHASTHVTKIIFE